ncbi:hypothetical protein GJ496_009761 [Pomphorhynchus laevis]|nr:hypothetical protein GJ496_009761 [Pomphorhynchus laevis]
MRPRLKKNLLAIGIVVYLCVLYIKQRHQSFDNSVTYTTGVNAVRLSNIFNLIIKNEIKFAKTMKFLNISDLCKSTDWRLPNMKLSAHENDSKECITTHLLDQYVQYLCSVSTHFLRGEHLHEEVKAKEFNVITAMCSRYYSLFMSHYHHNIKIFQGIVIYDLGLKGYQKKQLISLGCKIRRFPFEQFPRHVKNLDNYAFKPLVIQLALNEFGPRIIYGDTSIRYFNVSWSRLLSDSDKRGITARELQENYIPKYTCSNMFKWFRECSQNHRKHLITEAGLIVISYDSIISHVLMRAWIACALDMSCITCTTFDGIHRYDQSAFSILLTFFYLPSNNETKNVSKPSVYDVLNSIDVDIAVVMRTMDFGDFDK